MDLRYPIGQFDTKAKVDLNDRPQFIDQIAEAPAKLRAAIKGFSDEQLDRPYRPGGWTVRQVVHHLPDSHLNSYIRFKLALTEDEPLIKTYDEAAWASLADSKGTPVETSLTLLESLHARWVTLLRSLGSSDFERKINHPEWGLMSLSTLLALYAWHGKHHVAHITSLKEGEGWA